MIQTYRVTDVSAYGEVQTRNVVRQALDGKVRVLWTVPKIPPSLNVWERMHHMQRARTKAAWAEYLDALSRKDGLPRPCTTLFASAQIIHRRGAHRDLTNYTATLQKIFPDALMRIGVLKDDTADIMKWGPITLEVDKKLRGVSNDPRLQGITRIALIAEM